MKKVVSLILALTLTLAITGASFLSSSAEELNADPSFQISDTAFYYECLDRSGYQLTQEQLNAPTDQLVAYILEYPYIVDLYTSSVPYVNAYDSLRETFNGFAELERRDDAASVMLDMFVDMSNDKDRSSSVKTTYLQTLLEIPSYYNQLTAQEASLYSQYLEKAEG